MKAKSHMRALVPFRIRTLKFKTGHRKNAIWLVPVQTIAVSRVSSRYTYVHVHACGSERNSPKRERFRPDLQLYGFIQLWLFQASAIDGSISNVLFNSADVHHSRLVLLHATSIDPKITQILLLIAIVHSKKVNIFRIYTHDLYIATIVGAELVVKLSSSAKNPALAEMSAFVLTIFLANRLRLLKQKTFWKKLSS